MSPLPHSIVMQDLWRVSLYPEGKDPLTAELQAAFERSPYLIDLGQGTRVDYLTYEKLGPWGKRIKQLVWQHEDFITRGLAPMGFQRAPNQRAKLRLQPVGNQPRVHADRGESADARIIMFYPIDGVTPASLEFYPHPSLLTSRQPASMRPPILSLDFESGQVSWSTCSRPDLTPRCHSRLALVLAAGLFYGKACEPRQLAAQDCTQRLDAHCMHHLLIQEGQITYTRGNQQFAPHVTSLPV